MIVKSKGHCRHTLYLLKAPLVKFPLCYCVTISFVNLLTDTSAVQAVEVVEGEECMFITCYFAPGSTAQGCHVQMKIVASHSSQQLHSWQLNISRTLVSSWEHFTSHWSHAPQRWTWQCMICQPQGGLATSPSLHMCLTLVDLTVSL